MKRAFSRWSSQALLKILLVQFFVDVPVYCIGGPTLDSGDSWIAQWDVPRVMMGSLFLIIGFFLLRTLTKIDKNQDKLFEYDRERTEQIQAVVTDVAVLQDRCSQQRLSGKKCQ
jgi:hypothetical protein